MKKRFFLWSILVAALFFLSVNFGGTQQVSRKLVKVGGMKNHCDCTYRIE